MLSPMRLLLAGSLAFSLAVPALGAEPYITSKTMDVASLMQPPPVKGSPADVADMRAVLDAQAGASDARKAQALTDSSENISVIFGDVLGPKFVAAGLPATGKLFDRIGVSETGTLDPAKPVFGRVRPWLANPEVKTYAKPGKTPSYPSGHTTRVAIDAIVLAVLVPEKQREIWARAEDYADSRIIGGMHYPTDVQAGWRSGTAIAAVLFQQPEFRADLDTAKTELRAALGLSAEAAR